MGVGEITGKEHLSKAEPHRSKLPPTVQAVIAARLEQLSPQVRDAVNLAATIGRAFTFSVLAPTSSAAEDELIPGLDELLQPRVLPEQGGDSSDFTDAKFQQAAC